MFKALMIILAPVAGAAAQATPAEVRAVGTLYTNTGTDAGVGINSQRSGAFFSAAADDFTVPAGSTWVVTEVDVTGQYFNGSGPADSEDVTFYKASHGQVGKVVASYPKRSGFDENGSFHIAIPKTRLKAGRYFVSVVVNMSFISGGEWHWWNMLEVHGRPPQWESPGSGGNCQTWTEESVCFGPGTGDHYFAVRGHQKQAEAGKAHPPSVD